jgi:hypothetical protein
MGMKKPGNAFLPCRSCNIKGERRKDNKGTYYVPHAAYGLQDLPLREELRETIYLVEQSCSEEWKTRTGITRSSILLELESIHFPRSFPADIMHCVLQNITPTLFKLWNGTKLAIDDPRTRGSYVDNSGMPSYCLTKQSLASIGSALSEARGNIPTYLGHAPRRIDAHYKGYKAAEWKAWLLFYGVPLLDQRIDESYVENFRILGQFYSLATQHVLKEADVGRIAQWATQFVAGYERLYYRQESERLPVCGVNVHYLLHFSQYIKDCGPACYWWQFVMERYCGIIKPKARSKSQMNVSLANAVVINEHLNHFRFAQPRVEGVETPEQLPHLIDSYSPTLSAHQRRSLDAVLCCQVKRIDGFKRCRIRDNLVIGSEVSQRRDGVNRASHRICYRSKEGQDVGFGEVRYFVQLGELGQWAWVRTLNGLDVDRRRGVVSYEAFGSHKWIKVDWILSLIGVLRDGGVNFIVTDVNIY